MRTYWPGAMLALFVAIALGAACGKTNQVGTTPDALSTDGSLERYLGESVEELMLQEGIGSRRFACFPVSGESNRVKDIALAKDDDDRYQITWHYRNAGDYDQDGKVAISDVTPLAVHFGEKVGEDDNSICAVIDGDNDGRVHIGDITPIAINYGADVAGYIIQTSDSLGGTFDDLDEVYLADMLADEGRLRAEYPLSSVNRPVVRVLPFDSEDETGIVSDEFAIELMPPNIDAVYPLTCEVNRAVTYRADIEAEGQREYFWEFGESALPTTSQSEQPIVIMNEIGEENCSLTVTTPFGADTIEFTVTVVAAGAQPYITNVQPISGLANAEMTFSADVGGAEPITYGWDFSGYATPPTSSEVQPSVVFEDTGDYIVTLIVENPFGSDKYQYSLHVVDALNLEVLGIRIKLEGTTNTLVGDANFGTDLFRTYTGGGMAQGETYTGSSAYGYLDAIEYYYIPEDAIYGFDQEPPPGKADAHAGTLSYLTTQLDWEITCFGHEPGELFIHNLFEPPGHLQGHFGVIEDVYMITVGLPEGTLGVPIGEIELAIAMDVADGG